MLSSRIRILNCRNGMCIYNDYEKCMLEEITIMQTGECSQCVYPAMGRPHLSHLSEKEREAYIRKVSAKRR